MSQRGIAGRRDRFLGEFEGNVEGLVGFNDIKGNLIEQVGGQTRRKKRAIRILGFFVVAREEIGAGELSLQGSGAFAYAVAAVILGVGQLACAVAFAWKRDDVSARRLLRASLIYLPLLLGCLVALPGR